MIRGLLETIPAMYSLLTDACASPDGDFEVP